MKIGYVHNTYLDKRAYLYVKNSDIEFVRVPDACKLGAHLGFILFNKIWCFLQNTYSGITPYEYDILHLFNGVSFSSKPWVSSFEDKLPRLGKVPKFFENIAVKRLAHSSCKKLIAMSQNAANIQCSYLRREYPHLAEKILEKLVIISPEQVIFHDRALQKNDPSKKIVFTFIGRQFFRKGGREILQVFSDVCEKYHRCELNLVSTLETDQYASNTDDRDIEKIKNKLKITPKNIIYHPSLSNDEVMKLLKSTHVALLPTHDDSYGFSVLEAQACGTPVITTDIKALVEINNNQCGWVIKVPKDENDKAYISSKIGRAELKKVIQEGLSHYVTDIIKNPEQIKVKAERAFERIRKNHDAKKLSAEVYEIYSQIVNMHTC